MAEFNLRSDQVDVEDVMKQIRARIKAKRGVDYTEQEIRELAAVKLERFLDPRAVRSDLVTAYRKQREGAGSGLGPAPENYAFEDVTLYESHRGPLRFMRRLLNPLLKLLFNPNPLINVLNKQSRVNEFALKQFDRRETLDALNFEVLNNLVLELTKLGIENRNLRMRLESMATRVDFDERRQRAFEGLVQLKPASTPAATVADDEDGGDADGPEGGEAGAANQAGRAGKRRRRRRGRRRGPDGAPTVSPTSGNRDDSQDHTSPPPPTTVPPAAGGPDGQ